MIKQIVLCGTAVIGLVGATVPAWSAGQQTANRASSNASKPQLGDWGVDLAGMDKSVNPGDNFYNYVNGSSNDRRESRPAEQPTRPARLLRQGRSRPCRKALSV